MTERSSTDQRLYLYAVVEGAEERAYGTCGIGEGSVHTIAGGKVSAVVSSIPREKIRPERRHLAAHQEVMKRLLHNTTPLPITFGVVAESRNVLLKILVSNQEAFIQQLHRVAGKVEMGLRVAWDVPNIFEYFVSTHRDLRFARDRYFGTHREPTQEEKIEVGRMFERILNEDRGLHTDQVEEILSGYCYEIKRNKCRDEREVMNLACLVESGAQGKFEEVIFKAAALFDNNFAFDYNGPWAPHNFVDIDLKL
jgi:hypothetical protein